MTTTLESKGPHEAEIRHILAHEGTKKIKEQLAIYIRELKEEFSKGLILPTDKAKPQIITKGKTNVVVDKRSFQNEVSAAFLDDLFIYATSYLKYTLIASNWTIFKENIQSFKFEILKYSIENEY